MEFLNVSLNELKSVRFETLGKIGKSSREKIIKSDNLIILVKKQALTKVASYKSGTTGY